MIEQIKLSIYAAGSLESLARVLAPIMGIVHVTEGESFWEAGDDLVLSERTAKVEAFAGPEWMPAALDRLHEWHQENGQPTMIVEIARSFARVIDRDTD